MSEPKAVLKLVRNLLEKRRARQKEKCFVVEGPHLVEEAGDRIKYLVYSENLPMVRDLQAKGIPAYKISRQQFKELSSVETPQGVLAVVQEPEYQLRDILNEGKMKKEVLIVCCFGVQDPGNLGTIIRSADAFGAGGVILSKGTVDLYNPKVIRATMGSLFHLPIVRIEDEKETLLYLKEKNVKIVATEVKAQKDISMVDLKGPVAILMGNEAAGLSQEVIELADEVVKIPMLGRAESLNVGVSTAVVLYEALRQRTM